MRKMPFYLNPDCPEEPETPEEYKYCFYCVHCDTGMEPFVCFPFGPGSDRFELRYCNSPDMHPRALTDTEADASNCAYFEPNEEAREAAIDQAEYNANPYAYNGVNQRDFF